jgi:hypothetical protein
MGQDEKGLVLAACQVALKELTAANSWAYSNDSDGMTALKNAIKILNN